MPMLSRGNFASPGSSAEAEMGADVEVDCREGTNEHAVHLPGRPGNTHTTSSHPRHAKFAIEHGEITKTPVLGAGACMDIHFRLRQ